MREVGDNAFFIFRLAKLFVCPPLNFNTRSNAILTNAPELWLDPLDPQTEAFRHKKSSQRLANYLIISGPTWTMGP